MHPHEVDDLPAADKPAPGLRTAGVAVQLVDESIELFERAALVVGQGVRVAEVEIAEISPVGVVHPPSMRGCSDRRAHW